MKSQPGRPHKEQAWECWQSLCLSVGLSFWEEKEKWDTAVLNIYSAAVLPWILKTNSFLFVFLTYFRFVTPSIHQSHMTLHIELILIVNREVVAWFQTS